MKPSLPDAWLRSLKIEADHETLAARLLTGVKTRPVHVLEFGLAVEVTALPHGAIEPRWLFTSEGPLLTPNGMAIWNALLTLSQEVVDRIGPPGDFAAVILTPAAEALAKAQALADDGGALGEKEAA